MAQQPESKPAASPADAKDVPAYTQPDVKLDVMGKKFIWFGISGAVLLPGIIAIIMCMVKFGAPVKLGIDFTGGSLLQFHFQRPIQVEQLRQAVSRISIGEYTYDANNNPTLVGHEHIPSEIQTVIGGVARSSIAASSAASGSAAAQTAVQGSTLIVRTKRLDRMQVLDLIKGLGQQHLGPFTKDSENSIGPTIGKELLRNALIALGTGIVAILAYIAVRYQFDFAVCAIAAMVHDVLVMTGAFAIMSLLLGAEADSLLVTALLTVMGFSVHDTIVIFDRFRENLRYANKNDSFADVANRSVNQTFARSINTSLTVALTLLPLVIFGGSSIFYFTLSMLIGVISGTYSSIFNAAPLLVLWRDGLKKKPAAPAQNAKATA